MLQAGVVIDPWKLSIFEEELKADGFDYFVNEPSDIDGAPCIIIHVQTESADKLKPTVKRAQDRARKSKKQ